VSKQESAFAILERSGETELGPCTGPDELGHCPAVAWGDRVPCAGHELRPARRNGHETLRILVPAAATTCPITAARAPKRSVWTIGAMIATIGAVAGAAAATTITLAVTRTNGAATVASIPASATKFKAAAPALSNAVADVAVPGDRFSPAYMTIAAGTTVTWHNSDSDPHTASTAPGMAPAAFDMPLAPSGGTASYRFVTPGLYVIYCKAHATVDSANGMVKAMNGTDVFPETMAQVIAVTGAVAHPAGDTTVAVPGDRFAPAYLTVAAGSTVTWHNADTDPHTVTTVPGYAPVAFDLPLAPSGGTASFHFTTPGLYVFYCKAHATFDSTTGMVKAMNGTDVFPEAMAGAVFVTGS
jgi:plastocyanin